jgi:hypothetical protein
MYRPSLEPLREWVRKNHAATLAGSRRNGKHRVQFDGHIRAQLTVRKLAGLDVHGQQVASGQACLPADDPQVLPFPTHCAARQPRDGWQLTMTLLAGLRRTCTGS